ncbi:MAG TPA: UDP-2,3-diacylglucosamine diphosphatase [Candidatus Polarisedimenticolaceae bacterium]|nr:UDP-2,3-diacylglucosamine diphosphatase [Candidatus Polarisedimenticolaceae bacterium]
MPRGSDLVFVGDVHLDRGDPDLAPFIAYLAALGETSGRIVLMGDLFNLWLADPRLEQDHHRVVIEELRRLRRSGVEVHYLEGNRDYRVGRAHLGTTFDAVSDEGLVEEWAGRRLWAAHGDLVNREDAQYRLWRRVSRSNPVWALFSSVPERRRFAIAEGIERRMRSTNTGMKRAFPEEEVRAYAGSRFAAGMEVVVLGHFHDEKDLREGVRRIVVVPAWKESRRHLRVDGSGAIRMETA